MFTLNASHVTHFAADAYTMEAAELTALAGTGAKLPREIGTDLGNREPLIMTGRDVYDGEVQSWTYRQRYGSLTLTVFND